MTDDEKTPPEGSSGKIEPAGETQGSVNSENKPQAHEQKTEAAAVPERQNPAAKEGAEADKRKAYNKGLGHEDAVVQEPMTRPERLAYWTLFITAGLTIGTFALAYATWDMAGSTRQLAVLAKQQAQDTQDALRISGRQADAAEMANRISSAPEVTVTSTSIPLPTPGQKYRASLTVANFGRSPALDFTVQSAVFFIKAPQNIPPPFLKCENCDSSILLPTSGFQGQSLTYNPSIPAEKITQEAVKSITEGSAKLYVIARFDYRDGIGKHNIKLCFQYNTDIGQAGPCPFGNYYDIYP